LIEKGCGSGGQQPQKLRHDGDVPDLAQVSEIPLDHADQIGIEPRRPALRRSSLHRFRKTAGCQSVPKRLDVDRLIPDATLVGLKNSIDEIFFNAFDLAPGKRPHCDDGHPTRQRIGHTGHHHMAIFLPLNGKFF
jgi:hypothetical protein